MLEDLKYTKYVLKTKRNDITKQQHKAIWKTYKHVKGKYIFFNSSGSKKKTQWKLQSIVRLMKMGTQTRKFRRCNERRTQKFIAINTNILKRFVFHN